MVGTFISNFKDSKVTKKHKTEEKFSYIFSGRLFSFRFRFSGNGYNAVVPFIYCNLLYTVPFYLLYPFIFCILLSTVPFYLLYPFIYCTLLSTVTYSPVDCWRTFSLKISWSSEIFTTLLVTWGSNKCESGSVCIWTSRIPPPPDPALSVWNRILPSSGKNSKKTLHFYFFVTSF
jgi:hypothetical protein